MSSQRTSILILILCAGCATAWSPQRDARAKKAGYKNVATAEAVAAFHKADPGLKDYFKKSFGYAVFATVGKGALGVGAAYGRGEVFQGEKRIGTCTVSQITVGFQMGGQAYSEVIFFRERDDLERFKSGNLEFGAQASAVAATAGASANASYVDGVAIFTQTKGGLMYEASIGGQKFTFTPTRKTSQ